MIFKDYLKEPLATIAVNTTIFIAGCLLFGTLAFIGIISELIREEDHIRQKHVQQHIDEQIQYEQMIQLLDSIHQKLD